MQIDTHADTGWFEVSDEDGHTAALRPIATIVSDGKVYSLMGAIRQSETGESEGGIVLVRQTTLLHREGTRYEVVGDEQETERVMERVMEALMEDAENEAPVLPSLPVLLSASGKPREFNICDQADLLQ